MNIRTIWLMFTLLAILAIFIPAKIRAEESYILQCENGLCVMSQELLERLVQVVEYWKEKATMCKGI